MLKKLLFIVVVLILVVLAANMMISTGLDPMDKAGNAYAAAQQKLKTMVESGDYTLEVVAMADKHNNGKKYGPFTEYMCPSMGDSVSRDSCWTGLAVMQNHIEYCNNVEGNMEECVYWVKEKRDALMRAIAS